MDRRSRGQSLRHRKKSRSRGYEKNDYYQEGKTDSSDGGKKEGRGRLMEKAAGRSPPLGRGDSFFLQKIGTFKKKAEGNEK